MEAGGVWPGAQQRAQQPLGQDRRRVTTPGAKATGSFSAQTVNQLFLEFCVGLFAAIDSLLEGCCSASYNTERLFALRAFFPASFRAASPSFGSSGSLVDVQFSNVYLLS